MVVAAPGEYATSARLRLRPEVARVGVCLGCRPDMWTCFDVADGRRKLRALCCLASFCMAGSEVGLAAIYLEIIEKTLNQTRGLAFACLE